MADNPDQDARHPDGELAAFGRHVLAIDGDAVAAEIAGWMRTVIARDLHRRGAVVAVSGGVDSAVCLALASRALGPQRVLALLLPERDSSAEASRLGRAVCEHCGVSWREEDIAPVLEALGCYRRRDEAIRQLVAEYGPDWRCKMNIGGELLAADRISYFTLTVESPAGERTVHRLPHDVYLAVVAATNMKQRTRKLLEYHHAERLNYAVVGTPNRLEYDLGFFVRGGDGLADLKPIAHLYKTQVYALADALDVPEAVRNQPPSTDTYSLPQTQEEFYFALPYDLMDLLLYAKRNRVAPAAAAGALELDAEQVRRVYRDIEGKRRMADRLGRDAHVMR